MALRVGQNFYDSGSASDDAMNAQRAAIAMIIAEQALGLPMGTLSGVGGGAPDAAPGGALDGPSPGSFSGFGTPGYGQGAPGPGMGIGRDASDPGSPSMSGLMTSNASMDTSAAPGFGVGLTGAPASPAAVGYTTGLSDVVGNPSSPPGYSQTSNAMGFASPATAGLVATNPDGTPASGFIAAQPGDVYAGFPGFNQPGYSFAAPPDNPGNPAQQAPAVTVTVSQPDSPQAQPDVSVSPDVSQSPGYGDTVGMGFGGATGDGTSGSTAASDAAGVGTSGNATGISGGPGGSGEGGANTGEGGAGGGGGGGSK